MNLLFRTDASLTIGTGHVMRCLALAQAWQDAGGHALFAMTQATATAQERLRCEGVEAVRIQGTPGAPEDSDQTARLAANGNADWVVVDGYQFGAEYQLALKEAGHKILFIDDNGHAEHYSADLVLNQNAYASEDLYRNRESGTGLLLGLPYAMLRREFRTWRGERPDDLGPGGKVLVPKVLVTLGGSDTGNLTLRVIEALEHVQPATFEATIVAGGSSAYAGELEAAAAKAGVRLLRNVNSMPELMAWADIAVSGAGTTVLELAFMGVPAILLVTAENQRSNAQAWERLGLAQNLGDSAHLSAEQLAGAVSALILDRERRITMARSAHTLVDGLGADRVAAKLAAGDRRERNG
jgi:UDP-2,4-diacetamido-2,4,6-trideoxy-beta-L-altropyranose hydrolase